ncbi:MAG: hypothetical protein EA398_10385 [Deltaproteobacteria bacterium]|nr:MAG: hypothetical protein EA398_10385 [Deltaproteobacteria bacterium]
MKSDSGRHRFSPLIALGYLLSWPVMLLLGVYASVVLGLNTRPGAELVGGVLDRVLPGAVTVSHVAIGPTLQRVELFGGHFRDLEGRETIRARYATCVFRPEELGLWRVRFDRCLVRDGEVLVHELPNGDFGIEQVFTGRFGEPGLADNPPRFRFTNVTLENIDALINLEDAFFRLDGVDLRNAGFEITNRSFHLAVGAADVRGGRIVVSERLVNLGGGLPDWETALWEQRRSRDPWSVAHEPLPDPSSGERGLLELEVFSGEIRGFLWEDYWFGFDAARFSLTGTELDATGRVRVIAERPKFPQRESAILTVEGGATLDIAPDHPVFEWALPGVVTALPDSRIEPLPVQAYGTMRFFDGRTRLAFDHLQILDWPVERFEADLQLVDGVVTLGEGARARLWGGEVTGNGRFEPRTGDWSLRLCAAGLSVREALRPWWAGDSDADLDELLDARLFTSPSRCVPGDSEAGIHANGSLTLKALEVAPAATTPEDKEIQPPMVGAEIRGLQVRWPRVPALLPVRALRLDLAAVLDQRGRVRIGFADGSPGLQARAAGTRVEFGGLLDTVAGSLSDGRLLLDTDDLAAWARRWGVEALPDGLALRFSGPVSGPVDSPVFGDSTLTASLERTTGAVPAFNAIARLRTGPRSLDLDDLRVTSGAGNARARGRIGLFDGAPWRVRTDPALAFEAEVDDVALEFFVRDVDLAARLDGTFTVGGRTSAPEVDGRVEAEDLLVLGEPIERLDASLAWRPGLLAIEDFTLRKGLGEAAGRIVLDLAREHVDARVEACGIRPQDFSTLDAADLELQADLCLEVDALGPWVEPRIRGWLTADRIRLWQRPLSNLSATVHTFDCPAPYTGQTCLELEGALAGDFMIEGRIPLREGPAWISAHFTDLRPQSYFQELRGVLDTAAMTGEAAFTWDPRGSGSMGAILALDALSFSVRDGSQQFAMPRPGVVAWRMSPGDTTATHMLYLEDFALATEGREVRIEGSLDDFARLGLDIDGEVDFALLRLLPDLVVDAEGVADVRIRVDGTLAEPRIDGFAEFGEARVAPRGLGTNVLLEPGRVELTSDAILLLPDDPVRGTLFGGDFVATGRIPLQGLLPHGADLDVFVNGLVYRIPNELVITLLADVRFVAEAFEDPETWSLSGDVEVQDARYFRNFDVISDQLAFGELRRPTQRFEPPVWEAVPELGAILLDLNVTGRDRFRVESRVASAVLQLELQLDLVVRDRLRAMTVLGEADILEGGTVNYRGRRFEIVRGVLAFDGFRDEEGYPMPVLDAEMQAAIRPCVRRQRDTLNVGVDPTSRDIGAGDSVLLTAYLDGRLPYEVAFVLESTPFYDQRDLLSLILTGCTLDELTAASAGAPTVDLVFRPVIEAVERNVEERLDVDDVDIVPTAEGAAEITIRDEVTERLAWTLNARVGSEESNEQTFRVEYKLLDWLILDVREQSRRQEGFTLDAGFRFRLRVD